VRIDRGHVRSQSYGESGSSGRKCGSRKCGGDAKDGSAANGNDDSGADEAPSDNVEPLHVTPGVELILRAAGQG